MSIPESSVSISTDTSLVPTYSNIPEPVRTPVNVTLISLCVSNFVAVAVLPVTNPEEPVMLPVTFPVTGAESSAEIVEALKSPPESLRTTELEVLVDLANMFQ